MGGGCDPHTFPSLEARPSRRAFFSCWRRGFRTGEPAATERERAAGTGLSRPGSRERPTARPVPALLDDPHEFHLRLGGRDCGCSFCRAAVSPSDKDYARLDDTFDVVPAVPDDAENRFRRGSFLDGAGKGSQVAGILLDNWLKGRRRAVWISKSDNTNPQIG
jgi:P-loop containing NTP hydrolase pore-1